jgi:hypothetical protein
MAKIAFALQHGKKLFHVLLPVAYIRADGGTRKIAVAVFECQQKSATNSESRYHKLHIRRGDFRLELVG